MFRQEEHGPEAAVFMRATAGALVHERTYSHLGHRKRSLLEVSQLAVVSARGRAAAKQQRRMSVHNCLEKIQGLSTAASAATTVPCIRACTCTHTWPYTCAEERALAHDV